MKRTALERSDTHQVYDPAAKRTRFNEAAVTGTPAPATAIPPTMSEKQNLLALLGCRKEIAAGEFSVKLNNIGFHWELPIDVTIRIARELKSSAEWKGMILTSRQGYLSVDTAHPGRRFLGLKAELPNLSPGSGKVRADAARQFLDKLAPESIYSQAFLTGLSMEVKLATNLAVLCWSDCKVFTKELPNLREAIIKNLEDLKKSRGEKNFEDDMHAVLPLLRSGAQKKRTVKYQTHFKLIHLKLLSERKILSNPAAFLLEIQKAHLTWAIDPISRTFYDEQRTFKANAFCKLDTADMVTLATLGDEDAECEFVKRLRALLPEKRREFFVEFHQAVCDAFEQGNLSVPSPDFTWDRINNLLDSCFDLIQGSGVDELLIHTAVKTIAVTYRHTEKLWTNTPKANSKKFCDVIGVQTAFIRLLRGWMKKLPHAGAAQILADLPPIFHETLTQ
ncbi:MAG: hypothetical protein KGN40_08820 [Burkholderiales bacterium]|nr:hypothetical protein [Burkholderiales bacterium]